jgi:two-component sensor histidine kinase
MSHRTSLLINELVTNTFKYAFPTGFNCMTERGETCSIRVSLSHEDETDVLTVADNGCGLPEEFDFLTTKSLGLKLVNFLACYQLRAEIEVHSDTGTESIFHLKKTKDHA